MKKKWRILTLVLSLAMLLSLLPAKGPSGAVRASSGTGLRNVARDAVSVDAWFDDSYGVSASLSDVWWSISGINDGEVPIYDANNPRVLGWYSLSSAQTCDLYLQITLASTYEIGEVILYPIGFLDGYTFPDTYEILVSTDGNNWTQIGQEANASGKVMFSNGTPIPKSYSASSPQARYVMLHITKLVDPGDGNYYAALGEIEVMASGGSSSGSHAEGLIDIDSYGDLGHEIVSSSFDSVAYDGTIVTTDGNPLDYSTLSNLLPGYAWRSAYSPVNYYAVDTPNVITFSGWVGFDQPITAFGYIFGNEEPVFDASFMIQPEQGVINAGGQYAKRFNVSFPIKSKPVTGTIEVYMVAKLGDGSVIVFNSDLYYLYLNFGFELVGNTAAETYSLTIEGCNLAFENDTNIMYAVSGETLTGVKLLVWTSPRSSYTYGTQDEILEPVCTRIIQEKEVLVFEYTGFAAKQMADDVYVRAFLYEGGSYSYSEVNKYSVLKYVYNKTGRTGTPSANQKLIDVLESMLIYGAAAQRYFSYKTARLVTNDFYQISTVGGTISDKADFGLYLPGDVVTLTAPPIDSSGDEFSHWEDSAGNALSGRTVDITVGSADDTYTAVYEATSATKVLDFRVANVFSSDMVVQRREPVVIWGFADTSFDGGKIYGEFMGIEAEAVVTDGRWEMTFDANFEADGNLGNNMRFFTATKEVTLTDVLIGDVYFVIGQSNVALDMSTHWRYVDEDDVDRCSRKSSLDYPIRISYNTHLIGNGVVHGSRDTITDIAQKNTWKIPTKAKLQNFSAIGYLFAWNLCRLTDSSVPIGMIEFDGNGRALGCFLPNELADLYQSDTYNPSTNTYLVNGGQEGRFMYNDYLIAYEGMSIAGILWYQGESDMAGTLTNNYQTVYKAYMDFMRSKHNTNNKNFPVYFVEFPPIYTEPASYPEQGTYGWQYMDVGMIRGRMGSMVLLDDNFYQVQSSDLWHDTTFWNNLHPNCKNEQGLRAAKIACAVNGEGNIEMENASGPILESVTFSSNYKSVTLKYKNVGTGLTTSDGSTTVKGFQYGRQANSVTGTITATITGPDTVTLKLTGAAQYLYTIESIYYNCQTSWVYGTDINLCNSEGIPAGAFRMNRGE
ncbi:MAG: discoidin domain-containing protein [Clostridia bacterium]|nr:discoidin domain-containing protein [Clostridia bacterium]